MCTLSRRCALAHAKLTLRLCRDIKPANIQLDGNLVAKLGDVGIAKIASDLAVHHATHITTSKLAGTFAYMDPEYSQSGQSGLASDVYSYGVVLLQLLTGMPPLGVPHRVSAALNAGRLKTVLDAKAGEWPMEDAISLSRLALSCTAMTRNGRPSLGEEIVPKLNELKTRALSGGIGGGEVPYKYLCRISQVKC
jgi:serine/threonine protein kinase